MLVRGSACSECEVVAGDGGVAGAMGSMVSLTCGRRVGCSGESGVGGRSRRVCGTGLPFCCCSSSNLCSSIFFYNAP